MNKEEELKGRCIKQLDGIKELVEHYLTDDELEQTVKFLTKINILIYSGFTKELRMIFDKCIHEKDVKNLLEKVKEENENGT